MNDISNLDKDERIKALMFDNISKNTNLPICTINLDDRYALNNQNIVQIKLQKFFDKTWERFHYILDSTSVEYKDINGLNKFLQTSTFKMNNIDDLSNHLESDIYDYKSIMIYNLYEDLSDNSIKLQFIVVDDAQVTIRENRNKKINQLLDGKK